MDKLVKTKTEEIAIIKKQVESVKTLYDVVRLPDIVLAEERTELLIEMLIELNRFTNVSRKMNDSQIAETVNNMLIEYPRVSLQEYEIFFRRIKSGIFGQLYDSLDGIKIMAFLKDFYTELTKQYWDFKDEAHMEIKRMDYHRDLYK